jgi:hypothetical protein
MNRALPMSVLRAVRQVRNATGREGPIAVDGARELVPLLARELRAGGDAAAVTENRTGGHPSALVWVGKADHAALRQAALAGTPIVGLTEGESLPYVLDTNLVLIRPGQRLPVTDVAVALARVLGHDGPGLAARLPVLHPAVVDRLIKETVRKNALIGAAAFLSGADLPALTLNEALLTIRIAVAGGREAELKVLWPELVSVVGVGLACRRLAQELESRRLSRVAVRGGVALAGTWAVGEALRRRFA